MSIGSNRGKAGYLRDEMLARRLKFRNCVDVLGFDPSAESVFIFIICIQCD